MPFYMTKITKFAFNFALMHLITRFYFCSYEYNLPALTFMYLHISTINSTFKLFLFFRFLLSTRKFRQLFNQNMSFYNFTLIDTLSPELIDNFLEIMTL